MEQDKNDINQFGGGRGSRDVEWHYTFNSRNFVVGI